MFSEINYLSNKLTLHSIWNDSSKYSATNIANGNLEKKFQITSLILNANIKRILAYNSYLIMEINSSNNNLKASKNLSLFSKREK